MDTGGRAGDGRLTRLSVGRVARFNLVGAVGFVFQFAVLSALAGVLRLDPVVASVIATQATVLHNFAWHARWTWADRPASRAGWMRRLVRFNVSNGAISVVGGAIAMSVVTRGLGGHYLVGYVAGVVCCALANLIASEYWAFSPEDGLPARAAVPSSRRDREDTIVTSGDRRIRGRRVLRLLRRVVPMAFVAAAAFVPVRAENGEPARVRAQRAFQEYMRKSDEGAAARASGARPFLWIDESPANLARVRTGAVAVQPTGRDPTTEVSGGLVHDWIGASFIPAATVSEVIALVQDYDHHADAYGPEVVASKLLAREGNHFVAYMRLKRKKILTVVLDTEHDVHYVRVDAGRWHSRSVTTSVAEVSHAGEPGEHRLAPDEGHGFMWNLNSFWRFLERDGGVYVECQAVSLSRGIPTGLGLLIGPIVTGLPRESLARTLSSTRDGVARRRRGATGSDTARAAR